MQAESRAVSSNQQQLHPGLARVVARHLAAPSRKPVAAHNREAFALLQKALGLESRPVVLDSFCGTGHSTALLARRYPDYLVVGIDKSAHRLQRHPNEHSGNYLLLRADCEDIWRLLLAQRIQLEHHYILYPNPWPKSRHLQRRVHGHASFGDLLRLGGKLELRSNWQLYVEEFGLAMLLAGRTGSVSRLPEAPALTLFEEKYRSSGHALWRYLGDCEPRLP